MIREYKTRDGRRAIVHSWEPDAYYPAKGLVQDMSIWHPCSWNTNGQAVGSYESRDDLQNFDAEIWKPVEKRKATKALQLLNWLRWVPVTERMPTEADANAFGDVEWWSKAENDIWQAQWNKPGEGPKAATHWRVWVTPDMDGHREIEMLLNDKADTRRQ